MLHIRKTTILISFLSLFLYESALGDDCLEKRHIFELGSSTTRMTTYLVDSCQNNVIKILSHLTRKMAYQSCIMKHSDKKIDNTCIMHGIATLTEMQKLSNVNCKTDKCVGFATAWSRQAMNVNEVLDRIEKESNIKVYSISQEEEAGIAYKVVREILLQKGILTPEDPNIIMVDIGGGSFQITTRDNKANKQFVYSGDTGTESLSREIRRMFPQKKAAMMECKEIDSAYKFFNDRLTEPLKKDKELAGILARQPNMRTYGVGAAILSGLHVEFNLPDPITLEDLEKIIQDTCGMPFDEVAKLYPKRKVEYMRTTHTMFFFAHSIMKGLGIKELYVAHDTNPSYYIAKQPSFWSHFKDSNAAQNSGTSATREVGK